jgi:glycerol-3-phosphate dehydrogenase (NAD(P)+)
VSEHRRITLKITILGAGGFGLALAAMAAKYDNDISVWTPFEQEATGLNSNREHTKLLPGVKLSDSILITTELEKALDKSELIIIATPSSVIRQTAKKLADVGIGKTPVAVVSKGLEDGTHKLASQVLEEELPDTSAVVISGPSHAEEVARGMATTVVAASRDKKAAEFVQNAIMNEMFRIYLSDDIIGVQLGGAVKNVIALAAGILDGLKAGDNTKAALMTRGIAEIARLGVAMGAKAETFAGLSGIGDLIVTCSSMHSRNRRCGILIGQGVKPLEAVEKIGMTVEGYSCTKAAYELSRTLGVYMPITQETYTVLYENVNPNDVVCKLMSAPPKQEHAK